MEKRKNLHDYSLLLIFLAVLDLFTFALTVIDGIVDGSIAKALDKVEPDMLMGVKVFLGIIFAVTLLLTVAEALIGIKGLKVSREPNADKGYIGAAKVFFVLSIIATVSFFMTFFENNAPIIDTILNFVNVVLDVAVYAIFIKSAKAVRADVLAENK
jgi:hypothetical protein